MKLNRTGSNWTELERNKINENWSIIEGSYNDVVGQITDEVVGHLIDSAKLIWKEPVDTVEDLPTNAEVGETRMVREADPDGISYVYRYDGENWEKIQEIDVTLVNEVDRRLTRQLADKAELKVFQRIPKGSELSENELGLVLIPLFPFEYDFNGTSGLKWDDLKFETKKYEATTGLMNKEKSYSELKNNSGLIKVTKSASSGLASVENKVLLDLDFTNNKKYRIRFDVLRAVIEGANRGNSGISISPMTNPNSYYPFDYLLTNGMSFTFGRSSAKGNNVTINYRRIVNGSFQTNSNVAEAGGLTTSAAGFLALTEGEFQSIDLVISTNSLKLSINGTEYLNLQEDLSVLDSNACKVVFWGMNIDANSIEVNHFFDNLLIDEVV